MQYYDSTNKENTARSHNSKDKIKLILDDYMELNDSLKSENDLLNFQ